MAAALKEILGDTVKNKDGRDVPVETLSGDGKYIGLYFSAHHSEPCRTFTLKLAFFYNKLKESGKNNLEIIFVSRDKSTYSYTEYYNVMRWMTIPYAQEEKRNELDEIFGISEIPTLVILDGTTGEVCDMNACQKVEADPSAANFPWGLKPKKGSNR